MNKSPEEISNSRPDAQGLFRTMASGPEAERRTAFRELYARFSTELFRSFRWVPGAQYYGREDLVQDTFLRVYDRAGRFERTLGLTLEQSDQRVMGWLSANAKHLINENRPRDRNGFVRIVQLTRECWQGASGDEHAESPSPAAQRIRDALNALPDRDRTILLLYMEWYDTELVKQRIPPDYVHSICAHFQISSSNFRKIVSRTIEKVERTLDVPGSQET